ncbi:hypothetical protein JCM5353_000413 [Sporobolomyces roseus]
METHGVASYSLSYSIRDSKKDRHLQLYCSGSANESSCTSRIIARRTSTGNFKVTTVNEEHSCHEAEDPEESEKRVDPMESQDSFSDEERSDNFDQADDYNVRSRRARSNSEDEWKGKDDGSKSEDSASDRSEDSVSSNSSTNSTRFKTTEFKSKKGKEGKRSAVLTRFPPARDLRTEIAQLAIRPVSFPSPTQSFSEPPHRLLATLHAFAQQHGFALYRRNNNKTTLHMHCGLNHSRNDTKPGGRCRFVVSARRDQDGLWNVLPLTTQHNHNLSSTSTLPISLAIAATTAGSTSSLPQAKNFSTLPSNATRSSRSQPVSIFPTDQPLLLPRFVSPISTQNASFLDLASLLRPFHSSLFEAQRTLVYLHSIGVDSVETLTELLMMEDEGFERFVGGTENQIGKKLRMMRDDLQEELAG